MRFKLSYLQNLKAFFMIQPASGLLLFMLMDIFIWPLVYLGLSVTFLKSGYVKHRVLHCERLQ